MKRKLSVFQSKAWMKFIAMKRQYKNQSKGESHYNARLKQADINRIRKSRKERKFRMKLCRYFRISERHWYMIRSKERWKHL